MCRRSHGAGKQQKHGETRRSSERTKRLRLWETAQNKTCYLGCFYFILLVLLAELMDFSWEILLIIKPSVKNVMTLIHKINHSFFLITLYIKFMLSTLICTAWKDTSSLSEAEKGRKDTGRNVLPAGKNGEAESSCKIAALKESLLWTLWNLKDQSKNVSHLTRPVCIDGSP